MIFLCVLKHNLSLSSMRPQSIEIRIDHTATLHTQVQDLVLKFKSTKKN